MRRSFLSFMLLAFLPSLSFCENRPADASQSAPQSSTVKDSPQPANAVSGLAESVRAFRPRAEAGDVSAQTLLGKYYALIEDGPQAVTWLEKAAKQGNADAMFSLGDIYRAGKIMPKDATLAAEWLKKS